MQACDEHVSKRTVGRVECTRITDQRVGWVDRWIQVNRFTRPHVPCISAGCEVKSSGMKFKVLG